MNLRLTMEAIYDIADIASYIEVDFGEDRALKFEIDIEHRLERLDWYAHASSGIRYGEYPIYKDVFSPSLIFFVIREDAIHVLRVLREEQDWHNMLERKRHYNYPQ